MNLKEKLYKRNKLYTGKVIDFSADVVILPNKKKATREYTEHPNAVAVLKWIKQNKICDAKTIIGLLFFDRFSRI